MVVIRRANPIDAQVIARVHVASWQVAYRGLLPDEYLAGLSVEGRARVWTRILTDPEVDVFVSLDADARVVGFASLQASRDSDAMENTGEITAIYVLPEVWGCGFGSALLDAAIDRARGRNLACVTLWVLDSNKGAKRFYERSGFSTDGEEKTETRAGGTVLHQVRYLLAFN